MPYISSTSRKILDENTFAATTPGQLTYVITQHALAYIKTNGTDYQTYTDIIGALEGAKLEIYRRLVVPYEDFKISQNGDVF